MKRSMLSMRRCMEFRTEFNAETLLRTDEILDAFSITKGNGAASSNLSSSAIMGIHDRDESSHKSSIHSI